MIIFSVRPGTVPEPKIFYESGWYFRGIVSLMVDGSQLGPPFDGYNYPNVTVATVDYGSVPWSAGAHKLTFTLVGKNPNSINYLVGIDYLLLTKTN
jgi:hypothetical protein